MRVWLVTVHDCEGGSTVCICSTKKLAERELFKKRDELVEEWRTMIEWQKKREIVDNIYQNMINNLSGDDYEKWDNYPQDVVSLYDVDVIEK